VAFGDIDKVLIPVSLLALEFDRLFGAWVLGFGTSGPTSLNKADSISTGI
jgi:hypothetical protein